VKNDDGSGFIPTIVNGVISVNPNPNHKEVDSDLTSDSTTNLVNNLRDSTNALNKMKRPSSSKLKVVLVGDSHIRGYVSTLKPLLNSDYDLYCVVKPGSGTSKLIESAKGVIRQLSHDLIILCSSTNYYDLNGFSLTFQNIKKYMRSTTNTNILLMNIPF
jgi:hypothetical protein